jgi:hypothetical protein
MITIAQKDAITHLRNRMLSGDSGGGSFFLDAALVACVGGVSWTPSAPASVGIPGAGSDVDMAMLCTRPHVVLRGCLPSCTGT